MPRPLLVLVILAILLIGGAWFLASGVQKVPTAPIEEEVSLNAA